MRTSTVQPYESNFLDSHRSTVAVDLTQDIIQRRQDFFAQWQDSVAAQNRKKHHLSNNQPDTVDKSQRSSSAESKDDNNSSSPAPYPFHPDQLDPVAAAENGKQEAGKDDVKWYYSNYNSENLDPFVSPSRSEQVPLSSSSSFAPPPLTKSVPHLTLPTTLLSVLLSYALMMAAI